MEDKKTNPEKKAWLTNLRNKYKGENLSATEVLDFRDELVKKYGDKIIPGLSEDLNDAEGFAQAEYRALSDALHEAAPKIKELDGQELSLIKTEKFLSGFWQLAIKLIWALVPILALLALVKYLFS